jgi:hypothetical protein
MYIRLIATISLVTFGFCETPAFSQDFSSVYAGVGQAGLITNQTAITQAAIGRSANEAVSQNRKISSSLTNQSTLIYKMSLDGWKKNLANFVAKTRSVDTAAADELERILTPALMQQIDAGMRGLGLSSSNVADAYVLYWTSAWLGTRGRDDNLPSKQMIAVRNQAANALVSTTAFVNANDQQKQELTDALLVQSALIAGYVNGGKQNATLMPKVKAAIAEGAKAIGLDLYAMSLTPNGFVPAKRGSEVDESDLQPGSESDEQALASTEPTENGESPNYALIAAAGGAGLGGMFLLGKVMGRKS